MRPFPGRSFIIIGPLGSGKFTLLRVIAGLEDAPSVNVEIDGKQANNVPPAKRGINIEQTDLLAFDSDGQRL